MPKENRKHTGDIPFKEHFASIRRFEGLPPYNKRYSAAVTAGPELKPEPGAPFVFSRRNVINALHLDGSHAEDITDIVRTFKVHRPSAEVEELLKSILVLTAQYYDCVEARRAQQASATLK
jgi:hypothetical protein